MSEEELKQQPKEQSKEKIWNVRLSAIALIIWCIPGVALILNIFVNPIYNRINPSLPDKDLEKIEKIVDKKISTNTDLINILLFVLTALPIVGNFYFWLLYDSVVLGMGNDLQPEIKEQVEKQVNEQVDKTIRSKLLEILESDNDEIEKKFLEILNSEKFEIKDKVSKILESDNKIIELTKNMDNIQKLEQEIKYEITKCIEDSIKQHISGCIDEITKQNKEITIPEIQKALDGSIEKIREQIKQEFENKAKLADKYKDAADKLFAQGNYHDAIINYIWASLYEPDNAYFWYQLAEVHRQLKEYKSAIWFFNKVIELDQNYHRAYYYKAACHALEKQEGEAIESLKQAIILKPTDFKDKAKDYPAFDSIKDDYHRACFYGLIDDIEKAIESLKKAIVNNPENKPKARNESAFGLIKDDYHRACFYGLIDDTEKAIESLKKAIENNPEHKQKARNESAFDSIKDDYYRACFYGLIDDTEKAIESLKKAIENNPEHKQKARNESAFDSIKD
ncbi:MAG: tetratricopeptide repeat protein, partial [Nostocales cyanobacterium 94392]|nr:tetratricopeptide repeat protein [Nostocales cyanobacterium 94392]